MSNNLLDPGVFYYHPLTRETPKPHSLIIWPDGEYTEEYRPTYKPVFKSSFTIEDIVNWVYESINLPLHLRFIARDAGAVRWLIKSVGLDLALFCLDIQINHFLEAENRSGYSSDFILKAHDHIEMAHYRLGSVKMVAQQYGIDEKSYHVGR